MTTHALPLLRIACHLLPGGILPLRLNDAKQVALCKHAMQHNNELALGFIDPYPSLNSLTRSGLYPIGTRVRIIDFFLTPDQTLSITVEGIDRFNFVDITAQDGIEMAELSPLPNWTDQLLEGEAQLLANMLEDIYLCYPELGELYLEKSFHDATWISQRWLELLPISDREKQQLLQNSSCAPVVAYLQQRVLQQAQFSH